MASALAWPRCCHRMCSVKEIWDSAVFCFVPCKFPESTMTRLCCGAGWAVCRAGGGRDPLRHTVMPSGKEPCKLPRKAVQHQDCLLSLPALPLLPGSCLGEDAVMPKCPRTLMVLVVTVVFIYRCGDMFGGASPWQGCVWGTCGPTAVSPSCAQGSQLIPKQPLSPALCYNGSVQHNDDLKQPPSLAQVPVSGQVGQY